MSGLTGRCLAALAGVALAVGLAACGSSATKLKDAAFVQRCKSAKDSSVKVSASQREQLCTCVQQKAVAAGLGDTTVNDKGDLTDSSKKAQLTQVAATCAQQVLSGGAAGGSGAAPSTDQTNTDTTGAGTSTSP